MDIKKIVCSFSFVLVGLLFCIQSIHAQNYRLFNVNRDMIYARLNVEELDSLYYFVDIDSFSVDGTDTTIYFNRQLRNTGDPDCLFQQTDTTLLGAKAIALDDAYGTYVFFNNNGDSIFIRSNIQEDDVWHVYEWPDGSYVKATVINKLLFGVFPILPDTIFRIQLNVYTAGGSPLPDVFPNYTKIDISENFGLVEFFDMRIFPEPGDSVQRIMRGITNPYVHITNVDAYNAFDYETGYEFHYREESAPDNLSDADLRISAWKYFVLGKTNFPEGVTYTMERIQFDTLYTGAVPSSNVIWDTVEVTYLYADYAYLDSIPLTVAQQNNYGYGEWFKADSLYKGFAHKYIYDWYAYDAATECLSNPDEINMPEQLYGDGLGLMHYLDSTDATDYYAFDMVYFHVGLKEWGEPYDFSALDLGMDNWFTTERLSVHPNPATETLFVSAPGSGGLLSVYDLQGKLLIQQNVAGQNTVLSVSELPSGYYIIKYTSENTVAGGTFIRY